MQNVPIHANIKGRHVTGVADPVDAEARGGISTSYIIYIHGKFLGTLHCEDETWIMDRPVDIDLVVSLGEYIHAWYE